MPTSDLNDKRYDIACIITGRRDNLRMFTLSNEAGEQTGWVWVNIDFADELQHLKIDIKYQRNGDSEPINVTGR